MRLIGRRRHGNARFVPAPWALVLLSIAAFCIALVAGPVEAHGTAQGQPRTPAAQATAPEAAAAKASLVLDLQAGR
jgi:hypothetical protein